MIDNDSINLSHFSGLSEASRLALLEKEAIAELKLQEVINIIILIKLMLITLIYYICMTRK